jgi:hypothetical protein
MKATIGVVEIVAAVEEEMKENKYFFDLIEVNKNV